MVMHQTQTSLDFDSLTPRQLGAIGEARAVSAANPEWRAAALAALERVCRKYQTFIVDNIWNELGQRDDEPDRRAMAGILSEGERRGWCRRTDQMQRSEQRQCHGNKRRVWRSRLFS